MTIAALFTGVAAVKHFGSERVSVSEESGIIGWRR